MVVPEDVIKKHFRLWSLIQVLSTKIGLFTPILRVHLDGLTILESKNEVFVLDGLPNITQPYKDIIERLSSPLPLDCI